MKKILIFAAAMLFSASLVQADYAVQVKQAQNGETSLNELYNEYFAGTEGFVPLDTSQDLFDAKGIDPASQWRTSDSQIVGGYRIAWASHTLSVSVGDFSHDFSSWENWAEGNPVNITVDGILDLQLQVVDANSRYTFSSDIAKNTPDKEIGRTPINPSNLFEGLKPVYGDDRAHMIAFEVTDLYNDKLRQVDPTFDGYSTVYMFGWEDMHGGDDDLASDWDYQDIVFFIANIRPEGGPTSQAPEPATLAVLGLGLVGVGLASRRRRK